jgi:hypothetical protein
VRQDSHELLVGYPRRVPVAGRYADDVHSFDQQCALPWARTVS